MEYPKCAICKNADSKQKNSHLIPSFIISRVCSYDGSGKRGKEVMITMTPYNYKVYLGALPDTKVEELFDTEKLTEERINSELKINTSTKDYIFCYDCETKLSKYLETPYAETISKGKNPNNFVSYFFWLSIVWRMSISKQFYFSLPLEIEEKLGNCLHEYFNAIENNKEIAPIVEQCPFCYKILHCSLPSSNINLYISGRTIGKNLFLTLGEFILCVKFDNEELSKKVDYFGLEEYLVSAPLNNGMQYEQRIEIEKEIFTQAISKYIKRTAKIKLCNEKEKADAIWNKVGLVGTMPDEIFKAFMEKLYSEKVKLGDRKTDERYQKLFNETLKEFEYIDI